MKTMKLFFCLCVLSCTSFMYAANPVWESPFLTTEPETSLTIEIDNCQFDLVVWLLQNRDLTVNLYSMMPITSDVTVTLTYDLLHTADNLIEKGEVSVTMKKGQISAENKYPYFYSYLSHGDLRIYNERVSPTSDANYRYTVAFSGFEY